MLTRNSFKMRRAGSMIAIYIVFPDGTNRQIALYQVPNDKNWRADVDFYDSIMSAYKKRYLKLF